LFAFLFVFAPSSIQSCCCFSLSLVVGSIVLQKKAKREGENSEKSKKIDREKRAKKEKRKC